ncbi:TadE/TadG family type IV pilus assembly protein [Polynucleobacter arcticus]|uniref:Putative Flp pilus-assembly TadG-like N-terminal domain-containing protein n=1 Tax=Polynucleobacter arcticus TaxID=1743165 RepID=A0A6M9PMU2_9BURK|nr:Tad domain-containing protein [Polynucleobacter arcticus]QKM60097.1 hypothetical protein DN92_03050 [Polynucleobacter arcticus]
MSKAKNQENGSVAVIFALCLIPLIFFLAFIVDLGYLRIQKALAQDTADAVAIGCVLSNQQTPGSCVTTSSATAFSSLIPSGFNVSIDTITCPANPPGLDNCLQATAIYSWTPFFSKFVGKNILGVSANSKVGGYASAPCLLALNATGNFYSAGNGSAGIYLDVGGGGKVATACGVGVKGSNSAYQINVNTGTLDASAGYNYIRLESPYRTGGNTSNILPSITQASSIKNPHRVFDNIVSSLPAVTGQQQSFQGGTATLNPGSYYGIRAQGGSLVLNPGVYYIGDGGIDFRNTMVTATNVAIINQSSSGGSITIKDDTKIQWTAPTSGDYKGMILIQHASNRNTVEIMHNPSLSTFDGNLYLPGAPFYLHPNNSTSSSPGIGSTVADTFFITNGYYKFNAIKATKYYSTEVKSLP